MKKVLLSVSCINEYADDFPDLYCAELTPETIARIMHLNNTVYGPENSESPRGVSSR